MDFQEGMEFLEAAVGSQHLNIGFFSINSQMIPKQAIPLVVQLLQM